MNGLCGLLLAVVSAAAAAQAPTPPPAPYSLPWQLRPTAAISVVRSDTAFAFSSPEATGPALTTASMLLVSYKATPWLAPMVRLAVVNHAPDSGTGGVAFVNPVVGATWAHSFTPELRLGAFLGLTIPIGMGGSNSPDPGAAVAARSGILARSAMDNAMFAVNDFTVFPGLGLSYVAHGFTAQLEATVLQLTRVRGEALQPDAFRTNFTSGLHLGYFFLPQLSVGGELRYQRWLSTPASVTAAPATRETFTGAIGLRYHLKLGDQHWLRPGIAYARGFDDPMAAASYSIWQLDVPFNF